MQSVPRAHHLLAGLVLLTAGCHYSNGYQYPNGYGYPGYGYYGQPMAPATPVYGIPQGQPPGGTYTPGISPPGNGQPIIQSPTPTPTSPNTPSTYGSGGINWNNNQPAAPNPAAPFNPNPGTSNGNPGTGQVPNPDDMGNGKPSANKPMLQPTPTQRTDAKSPFDDDSSQIQPVRVDSSQSSPPEELPEFEQPIQQTGGVQRTSSLQKANLEMASDRLSPYGHDTAHANPQWLRGVIEKQGRAWQIMYAESPDPNDPNGGSLTLANHPDLAKCRDGDIVMVEGAIDGRQTDARGKAIYVLDSVTKLSQ